MKIEKTETDDREILRGERDAFAAALEILEIIGAATEADILKALRTAERLAP